MMDQQVQEWIATFNLNQWVIEQQTKGLTHADSLLPLPFQGNRMNWVIGHIVEHRDWMLRAVDGKTLMPAKEVLLYRRGSEELTDDDLAVNFDTLMGYLQKAKEVIVSRLTEVDEAFLMEIPTTGILMESHRERTRLQRLQGLLWHETYHVGQLELLRQLTGVNDKILS